MHLGTKGILLTHPSEADIYWYNEINPLLLTALCSMLTPCCSLLSFYNSIIIVECLKWGMHVRCEHHELGLLLFSFCCLNWCSVCKNVTYWTVAIVYCNYTVKIHVAYQNNSFQICQWQTNERVWKTHLDCNVRVFWKNKSIPFDPLWCPFVNFWAHNKKLNSSFI